MRPNRILSVAVLLALAAAGFWWRLAGPPAIEGQALTAENKARKVAVPQAAGIKPAPSQPAQTAEQPPIIAAAKGQGGTAMQQFVEWTEHYRAATPAQQAAMEKEGARLAAARRSEFKQLIVSDPRRALQQAVPMTVRQSLPTAIVELLEERVNRRADLVVYQGSPAPGEPLPQQSLTHRIATFSDQTSYVAHVFGDREQDLLGTRNDALNGVAIDNQFAVNDEPVRLMEAGERPDPKKTVLTSCPVSGNEVVSADKAAEPIPADVSVVETPEQIAYLCGGYHKGTFINYLYAEGGTGGPVPVTGILPAAPTPALGMLKVIFISMTFADQNVVPTTEAKSYQMMRDVADYYAKASFGKLTTLTTVTPPVKLPHNEAWYIQKDTSNGGTMDGLGLEMAHAREEAKRLGYDYLDYDCTVLRLTGGPRTAGGYGGGGTVWIFYDGTGVIAHEIGHSFALSHANFWDTGGTSAIGAGTNAEYGDIYDIMGSGAVPIDHYNAQAKSQVKWLTDDYIADITQSGAYRVYAFDQPMLDPANRYAIRITKDAQRVYWGEVRQLYNGHASRPWTDKGMLLGWRFVAGGTNNIHLIDTTPGSSFGRDDAAISLGRTFSDDESNIHITTVGVSSTTPKYVDLVVNMGAFPDNHAPTLSLAASAQVVPVNATVTFTATGADADGDSLAYSWQHFGDLNVRLVSPNAPVSTRTFTTAGTYVVTCTVSDMKGGTATRNQLITVGNGGNRYAIAGRITANGVGMSDVVVNANGANAVISDSDGYYIIPNLSAGAYAMTPLLYGQSFTALFTNSVTVAPNFTGADFAAEALPRVSITATVADAQEPGVGTPAVAGRFTLARTEDFSQELTVNVNSYGGTATLGADYTSTPSYLTASQGFSTFTIPAGQASLDITLDAISDASAEGPETVVLQLGPGGGYVVANPSAAMVTINDDPADSTLPKVSLAAATVKTLENSGMPAVVKVSRMGSTIGSLTVNYTLTGTATAGADYVSLTGSVTIPAGAAAADILVTPLQDGLPEALETVVVTATANAGYLVQSGANAATVSIVDNDTPIVTVTAPDSTAAEVDLSVPGAKAGTGTFVITRTGDTAQPLTVYYALSSPPTGEAALHGVDYEALPAVLVIPAGAANATVTIIPRWDNQGEGTEWMTLNLSAGPTTYKVGAGSSASISIQDAAANPPTLEVIGVATPAEPNVNGVFRFTVRSPSATPVTVNYTLSGTAAATVDYTMLGLNTTTLEGSITLTPNVNAALSQDLTVTVVNDALPEDLKSLTLTITPSALYQTFSPTAAATLWLKDEDQPAVFVDPHLTNYPASVPETGTAVAFYLSRTGSTTNALTVNYVMSGTAANGVDYNNGTVGTPVSGVAVIPAGAQGVDVVVRPVDDSTFEGTESITLTLAAGSYGLGPPATLYLTDNDTATQIVTFGSASGTGLESTGSVNIPVSLTVPATAPVSVEYVVDSGNRSVGAPTTNNVSALPYWVRVVRTGNSFVSFQSPDGVTWTQRGNATTVTMSSASYLAGLAVTSNQANVACSAFIDNVSITNLSVNGTAGAESNATVGTIVPAGSSSLSTGVYHITAGGGSIGSATADGGFYYVCFPVSNSANCTLTARVLSLSAPSGTRAGVMIRETTAANAAHATSLALVTGNFLGGARMATGTAASLLSYSTLLKPLWLRLQRAGNVFSAAQSPDGIAWTNLSTPQMNLPPEVLAGLAVSARSDGLVTTATFDNVSLTGSPALVGRTVGYVNVQGTDSVDGGVYTVTASGANAISTEDECHFVAAPVTGDFTLIARLLTQSGGAANAQAGVMVRESGAYRARSLYLGSVANAGSEFIFRAGTVTSAYGTGVDFSLSTGVVNFAIGQTTQTIPLQIHNDALPEPDEALVLILRHANGAAIGSLSQFTYVIQDDDLPPDLPCAQFAQAASSAEENGGGTSLRLVLSAASTQPVTVDIAATGGTAVAGADYSLVISSVTFAPGETVKDLPLTLLNDAAVESSETVIVTVSNPVNATLGSQDQHTLTLIDDEFPVVTIEATDPTASETNLETGTFTFYRTGPTTNTLIVNYGVGGTASSATDREGVGTTVTFAAGSSTALRLVIPKDDQISESAETVILTLSPNAAYTVGSPNAAAVTILDDDRSTVSITADAPNATETVGSPGRFTLTRSAPTTANLNVTVSMAGTAANTTDYTTVSTTVTILAGESSRTVDISPVDDGVTEGTEVVIMSIAAGSYDIGASSYANVTIMDNDSPPIIFISSPAAQGMLIASGNGLMLNCEVSDDGAPQAVTLNWVQAGGPGVATFENPTQAHTAVTFSSDGAYLLKVTATDGQFTVSDQLAVVVGLAIAPTDWITQDILPTAVKRGQTQNLAGVYTITGSGAGYASGSFDGGHVMMRQVAGDGSVIARLTSLTGGATSLAGVSIRDTLYRGACRAVLGLVGSNLQFRTRITVNASDTMAIQGGIVLPAWVKLERNSATNAITASYAPDAGGVAGAWTQLGNPVTVPMDANAMYGLTVSSGNTTMTSTAVMDNLSLTPGPAGPALITEDAGSANSTPGTYSESNGTYTIGGSGGLDSGGFFAGRQYVGDLMVTAKLANATSGATSAKSGLMIRESMDSGGYVFLGRIPTGAFSGYLWRTIAGGAGNGVPSFTGKIRWMRLVRQGNRITAFHAADVSGNPGAWVQLGQPQTVIMTPAVQVGFCVDNSGGVGLNVATFTNLSIVPLNKAPIVTAGTVAAPVIVSTALHGTVVDDSFPTPPNLSTLWSAVSGPSSAIFADAAAADTSVGFSGSGDYRLRLTASDGSIATFADLNLFAYSSAYARWQDQNFVDGLTNPEALPEADPDDDRLNNFLEFAFNTDPFTRGLNPIVEDTVTSGSNRYLRLSVPKNPEALGFIYTVEATSDLANPDSWTATGLVIEQNTASLLRVRDSLPYTTPGRHFMRVRVRLPQN